MAVNYTADQVTSNSSSMALDYSDHFNLLNDLVERVAIAAETLATNSTNIKNSLIDIASDLDTIRQDITTIRTDITTIKNEIITIDDHLDRMQSVVEDVTTNDTDERDDNSEFSPGPHIRQISTTWYNRSSGNNRENTKIARGMMMINLKETDKLDDLRSEVSNPTSL